MRCALRATLRKTSWTKSAASASWSPRLRANPYTTAPDGWIAPAFFDVQINGGRGVGFTSPALTPEGVRSVANLCREHGIGGFCPTVITAAFGTLAHAFTTLRVAVEQDAELAERLP